MNYAFVIFISPVETQGLTQPTIFSGLAYVVIIKAGSRAPQFIARDCHQSMHIPTFIVIWLFVPI